MLLISWGGKTKIFTAFYIKKIYVHLKFINIAVVFSILGKCV